MNSLRSPLAAQIVQWLVAPGDQVGQGQVLVILEAMKMEHELRADAPVRVLELRFALGDAVQVGDVLLHTEPVQSSGPPAAASRETHETVAGLGALRPDLQRVLDREAHTFDAARPEAVARRHALGLRTARENIADLCDEGGFIEYGALAVPRNATAAARKT